MAADKRRYNVFPICPAASGGFHPSGLAATSPFQGGEVSGPPAFARRSRQGFGDMENDGAKLRRILKPTKKFNQ